MDKLNGFKAVRIPDHDCHLSPEDGCECVYWEEGVPYMFDKLPTAKELREEESANADYGF